MDEHFPERASELTEERIALLKDAVRQQYLGEIVGALYVFMVQTDSGRRTVILDDVPEEKSIPRNMFYVLSDLAGWMAQQDKKRNEDDDDEP